jgi:hypothetical protein
LFSFLPTRIGLALDFLGVSPSLAMVPEHGFFAISNVNDGGSIEQQAVLLVDGGKLNSNVMVCTQGLSIAIHPAKANAVIAPS